MGKSYLGRAIIELGRGGGKGRYSKGEGRWRHKVDGDGEFYPPQRKVTIELRDNLNPLHRWLDSKIGTSWNEAFSEFCKKVDRRSLQGDHILSHLYQMVKGSGGREYVVYYNEDYNPPCYAYHGYYSMFVDEAGILRKHTPKDCEEYGKQVGWKKAPPRPQAPYQKYEPKRDLIKEAAKKALIERNALLHPTLVLAEKVRQ